MRDAEYVRSLPVGVRHVGHNVAVPVLDPAALRVRRHILLAGAQDICYPFWLDRTDPSTGEIRRRSEFQIQVCGRVPVADAVRVYRNGPTVSVSGAMRCGNLWGCPFCAAKVMRLRSDQIAEIFAHHQAAGGYVLMVTYTAAHSLADPLTRLMTGFKAAQARLGRDWSYRRLAAERVGLVVATEITYGTSHGWHVHQHQCWFMAARQVVDCDDYARRLFPLWRRVCEREGLATREWSVATPRRPARRVGVDIRLAWDASEYLTKFDRERTWSLSAEMTAGRLKTSAGKQDSFTPWEILEDAILRGRDSQAAKLWLEYLRATKGKYVISLIGCRDLLKAFGLPTSIDDFADANAPGDGEVIGSVSADAFDRVVRAGGLGRLLEAARAGGLSGLDAELQSLSSFS